MQYSEEVSLELARRLSAADHRLSSRDSIPVTEGRLIGYLCHSIGKWLGVKPVSFLWFVSPSQDGQMVLAWIYAYWTSAVPTRIIYNSC